MPKALIITYYWPPAGGSGVQRWLKFVKYLREFGWEPVVYTALKPEAPVYDDSLFKDIPEGIEVIHRSIFEPYHIYKRITGRKNERIGVGFASSSGKKGLIHRVAAWVRGNFFIPDARMLWIWPSVKYLTAHLTTNPVDIVISTGPPHSAHLIARGLKRKLKIPWLADFRDPWTNIDFYKELHLTFFADKIHHKLEKSVVLEADAVTTVSESMLQEYKAIKKKNVFKIYNGYDHTDYPYDQNPTLDEQFTISHFGVVPPSRNCPGLWRAMKMLIDNYPDFAHRFKVVFYGQVDASVIKDIEKLGLQKHFEFKGFVSHSKVTELQKKSQVLLLLVNNTPNSQGIVTGKIFEYMASKRPVLAIGPKGGDLDDLIKITNSGILLPFDDELKIFEGLKWYMEGFNNHWIGFNPKNTEGYSRKELTRKLVGVMNNIISNK